MVSGLCYVGWLKTRMNIFVAKTANTHKKNLFCLHRLYLISGGVPFIICGVTAATNIKNYGNEDNAA